LVGSRRKLLFYGGLGVVLMVSRGGLRVFLGMLVLGLGLIFREFVRNDLRYYFGVFCGFENWSLDF
jgi:hypothetical protein